MSSWEWLVGYGRWHTLGQCLGDDPLMVTLVVFLDGVVALLYLWISFYWWRCEKAVKNKNSVHTMKCLRHIFIWCALSGYGFRLLKLVWPAWWLWVAVTVVLIGCCFRFVVLMRNGLMVVYQDMQTLQNMRNSLRFVETGQMELDAIKNQLCEIKSALFKDSE